MGRERFYQNWIDDLFVGVKLLCSGGSIKWELGEKLSEKARFVPELITGTGLPEADAQAVYHCKQIKGPSVGMDAIAKVRMQVPPEYPASLNPLVRRELALRDPPCWTTDELQTLRDLNQKGCKVTPKLLNVERSLQDWDHMPVPGGYMIFIVMEKVPGVPLVDFWDYDFPKREMIRAAFRSALIYHARPLDTHLGNVMYDEKENKCWFVDYEDVYVMEDKKPKVFSDNNYFLWGLARRPYGEEEKW
ncbi:hypothetical protein FQN50_000950 [Emmonsiellopsis sp. PD_5]|nr:hypothetical protein FQN50_000950 [Emmonsiellopsis sp. PD_5]